MSLTLNIFQVPYTYPECTIPSTPLPPKNKPLTYYTKKDISLHNHKDDIWVSWHKNVYNLTPLIQSHKGTPILKNGDTELEDLSVVIPLLKYAGEDISHWFDPTGEIKSHVSALTEVMCAYTPEGVFVDVPPCHPRSDYAVEGSVRPWWKAFDTYFVGRLGETCRKVRLVNTLVGDEVVLDVTGEEALVAIQERYLKYNSHARGYMWKYLGNLLDMSKTLEENEIVDEQDLFDRLGMDADEFIPTIHLIFSDDLTTA